MSDGCKPHRRRRAPGAGEDAVRTELGAEPPDGSPDQAAAFIRGEQDKWGKIIRDAGIKQQ